MPVAQSKKHYAVGLSALLLTASIGLSSQVLGDSAYSRCMTLES